MLILKDIDGATFENEFGLFEFLISSYCDEHVHLKDGENITDNQREIFDRLILQKALCCDEKIALAIPLYTCIMKLLLKTTDHHAGDVDN